MTIAVITYEARGSYGGSAVTDEDEMLRRLLTLIGYDFHFEVWSDPTVDWRQYSHILIKSPWDYFDRYQEFISWCDKIRSFNLIVMNDLDTVLWNSDKRYLQEIQHGGFPIVPTLFLDPATKPDVASYFEKFSTLELIIKPTVSGGAKNTFKLNKFTWKNQEHEILEMVQQESFMVQPFIKEVSEVGEYSYVFFNGKFSHAVLKSPKAGEFRVQHFFGGQVYPIRPTPEQLAYLQDLVDQFARSTLYARVDGVWIDEVFHLMELELIEPYLFLFTDEKAIENYKEAIQKKIK